ncbi:MAG: ubiquitin-like small modifier protein 1 [Myxococcales bacterium]|nr:MoaD/ThiS family protein [Myxococcales bacterium]HIM00404.1 MoaD/ThiS family protein [Myxococcales bacterium]
MRVGFYATLRKIVGTKYVEFPFSEEPALRQVIDAVLLAYPELSDELLDESGEFSHRIHLMVDGRSSKWLPGGLDTVVTTDQTIEFFPAVAGG